MSETQTDTRLSYWHNYVTGESVLFNPASDDEARQFIPQTALAQMMYGQYRAQGHDIKWSLWNVLIGQEREPLKRLIGR